MLLNENGVVGLDTADGSDAFVGVPNENPVLLARPPNVPFASALGFEVGVPKLKGVLLTSVGVEEEGCCPSDMLPEPNKGFGAKELPAVLVVPPLLAADPVEPNEKVVVGFSRF